MKSEVADNLDGLVEQLPLIEGSHAQREVFDDTSLESYIRYGRYDKAQDLFNTYLKRRTSVRDELWFTHTMPEAAAIRQGVARTHSGIST